MAAIDNRCLVTEIHPPPLLAFSTNLDADMLFDESGTTSDGDHPDPDFRYAFSRKPSAAFVMGILAQWHHGTLETFDKGRGGCCSDYQPTMQSIQISERPKIRRFGAIFPEHRLALSLPKCITISRALLLLVLRSMVPLFLIAIHSVHP
jgi:hypothetical protein